MPLLFAWKMAENGRGYVSALFREVKKLVKICQQLSIDLDVS